MHKEEDQQLDGEDRLDGGHNGSSNSKASDNANNTAAEYAEESGLLFPRALWMLCSLGLCLY